MRACNGSYILNFFFLLAFTNMITLVFDILIRKYPGCFVCLFMLKFSTRQHYNIICKTKFT